MPDITTVKELRELLKSTNATWAVNEALKDTDKLSRTYSLGADTSKLAKADETKKLDFKALLGKEVTNAYLTERRIALNILPASARTKTQMAPQTTGTPVAGLSTMVDWRNRFGWPWITSIQDQDPCESCWVFGSVATVETMVRIEHAIWSKRSEGDVHRGMNWQCANGGNPSDAFNWMTQNGVADPDCYPYVPNSPNNLPYHPTPDRSGRTVKIPAETVISSIADQKTWIDTVGPLAACFEVYNDFFALGTGIYRKTPGAGYAGNHCICIVGYDETHQCWICKNSWGPGFGDHGYFRIAYGQCNIDAWSKIGVRGTNPDPWTKRRCHNGATIESGNGSAHRNFEMTVQSGANVQHWWRDGSTFAWSKATKFGTDCASTPCLTGTTYNRNFEMLFVTTGHRLHHWYLNQSNGTWTDGGVFGPTNATGHVGFLQGNYGAPGNFEAVVALSNGTVQHWWRNNGGGGWAASATFANGIADAGLSLVQTMQPTGKNNLEFVGRCPNGELQHWIRHDNTNGAWAAGQSFAAGCSGPAVMIQGQYGMSDEKTPGNLELVVAAGGQVQHWWCGANRVWAHSTTFGSNVAQVISLVEGSFGFNLEVVVLRTDGKYEAYFRAGSTWTSGGVFS